MAGADRMTIEEVVWQVKVREHGDVLRAAVEAVCAQLMGGEVSELIDAPGRDATDIGLLDHAQQRPLRAPARLQKLGK